jgi:hypothetical protein
MNWCTRALLALFAGRLHLADGLRITLRLPVQNSRRFPRARRHLISVVVIICTVNHTSCGRTASIRRIDMMCGRLRTLALTLIHLQNLTGEPSVSRTLVHWYAHCHRTRTRASAVQRREAPCYVMRYRGRLCGAHKSFCDKVACLTSQQPPRPGRPPRQTPLLSCRKSWQSLVCCRLRR